MEIVDLLTASKENMKAAIEIERNIAECKKQIMIKLFRSLEAGLGEQRLSNEYDYADHDYQLVREVAAGKWKSPGVSFPRRRLDNKDVDIWLRIEICPNLCAGFITVQGGKKQSDCVCPEDLAGVLQSYKIDNMWVYAEELPVNSVAHSPNFMSTNEEYFDLFDAAKYDQFIEDCLASIRRIDGLLMK